MSECIIGITESYRKCNICTPTCHHLQSLKSAAEFFKSNQSIKIWGLLFWWFRSNPSTQSDWFNCNQNKCWWNYIKVPIKAHKKVNWCSVSSWMLITELSCWFCWADTDESDVNVSAGFDISQPVRHTRPHHTLQLDETWSSPSSCCWGSRTNSWGWSSLPLCRSASGTSLRSLLTWNLIRKVWWTLGGEVVAIRRVREGRETVGVITKATTSQQYHNST